MLSEIRSNRSLTFFQPTSITRKPNFFSEYVGGVSSIAAATVINNTATVTNQLNTEFSGYLDYFQQARVMDASSLDLTQVNQAARSRGVYRAWQYEKADIAMGGNGSAKWTAQEKQDILDNVDMDNQLSSRSGVRGAEGHHQKNVADHPDQQANPDNIKFFRTRKEHLEEGHHGDWHNETDSPMSDKDQMLRDTNDRRVKANELHGLKMAAIIGVGVGFTIGFAVELAKSGVSPESIKYAVLGGAKAGTESGVLAVAGFSLGRTIGETAANAVEGLLTNVGVQVTQNIAKMCYMGVAGLITVSLFSAYQFIKLKLQGVATKEALIQVGKQALFSLSLIAVSIVAQGIWGGAAGLIVSTSIGVIFITYSIVDAVHQRKFSAYIREYMIEKSKPYFGGV